MDFEPQTPDIPNGPVPLFPLPGIFLFPHQVLPLHIFEDRYREMVADLLDGPGRLVIAAPRIGNNAGEGNTPDVVPVAGLGEILRHEKLEDGRFMIWVLGLARVHIQEVASESLYRMVECLPFIETTVPEPEAKELVRELRDAASARLKEPLPLPDSTPPGLLADLLMQTLQASRSLLERAYVEPDVTTRAQLALREAERRSTLDETTEETGDREAEDLPGQVDIPDIWPFEDVGGSDQDGSPDDSGGPADGPADGPDDGPDDGETNGPIGPSQN